MAEEHFISATLKGSFSVAFGRKAAEVQEAQDAKPPEPPRGADETQSAPNAKDEAEP